MGKQSFEDFAALVDADICKGEFLPFKRLFHQNKEKRSSDGEITVHSSTKMMEILFGKNRTSNRTVFAQMFKLITACHCVLFGNSEAERVFSSQNRIKTKDRSGLTIEHLDQPIRLSHNKIPIEEFDFQSAYDLFMAGSNRRISNISN